MFPELSHEEQQWVVESIAEFYSQRCASLLILSRANIA